jgi:hypothetical protein
MLAVPGAVFASHVVHDVATSPARSDNACDDVGGVRSQWPDATTNGGRQCVVTESGGTSIVPGSHPNKPWTVELTTSDETVTYVITRATSTTPQTAFHIHAGGTTSVTGCWNHQGNAIVDFLPNPNCVPAS